MDFRVTNGVKINELSKKISNMKKVVDPVCEVKVKEGVIKTDYKGKTYSFCSENCRVKFTIRPFKYVNEKGRKEQ